MKNLKKVLSFNHFDFTAIQILLSIIAISLVGIVSSASTKLAKSDFHKPILPIQSDGTKVCSIPYSNELCESPYHRTSSCELGGTDIFKTLNLPPPLKTNERPLCSLPNHQRQKKTDSPFWQKG